MDMSLSVPRGVGLDICILDKQDGKACMSVE